MVCVGRGGGGGVLKITNWIGDPSFDEGRCFLTMKRNRDKPGKNTTPPTGLL